MPSQTKSFYKWTAPVSFLFLLCAAVAVSQTVYGQGQRPDLPDHVSGRLVVQHREAADLGEDEVLVKQHGARIARRIENLRVSVLELPEAALDRVAARLAASGKFTFVERDFVAHGAILPNDPSFITQWHLTKLDAPSAWNITTGSTAVPVAVIDSGVDGTHPDLAGKLIAGWNFLSGNNVTADVLGHGTAVAGTIGAATDNGVGISGLGWKTPIMPLVVLNASDYASYSNVASAIIYAADHGVRIINVSICGTSSSSVLQNAVDYAWNKGALVFAAAGNQGSSALSYPAACARAIAVSSTEKTDARSSFSNYGPWITLSAPGNYILTTNRGGGYGQWYGTSFSSPIAAGVAAMALSVRPAMSRDTLLNLLKQTSDDLGTAGFDSYFGYGRVNAYKAVNAAASLSSDSTAPVTNITAPSQGATVSGLVSVNAWATDAGGVAKCELYVDSKLTATGTASVRFSWDSRLVANGSHALQVRCTDRSGNAGAADRVVNVSNPVTTVTTDSVAPSVSIITLSDGQKILDQQPITAAGTDNVAVSQVSLYVDGIQYASCALTSCSFTWSASGMADGAHTISAKAWDRAGNAGVVSITVYK